MKVIRYIKSGEVIVAAMGSGQIECFYIPKERAVLSAAGCGVGGIGYLLDDSPETLREARTIATGKLHARQAMHILLLENLNTMMQDLDNYYMMLDFEER